MGSLLTYVVLSQSKRGKRRVVLDSRNAEGQPGFVYNKAQIYGAPGNEVLHLSGQVAIQLLGAGRKVPAIKDEIRQCLQNVKDALEASGSSMDKVV